MLAVLPFTEASCLSIVLEVSCDTSPIVLVGVLSALVLGDLSSDGNAGCPTSLPRIRLIVDDNGVEASLSVLSSTDISSVSKLAVLEGGCDTAPDVLGDVPSTVALVLEGSCDTAPDAFIDPMEYREETIQICVGFQTR